MKQRTEVEMLSDFVGGISTMIDASSQMASCHRLNPKWLAMRDMLNIIKDGAVKLIKGEV